MDDCTSLDPIYSQLRRELDQIVEEKKLQVRRRVIRTPMHLNSGDGMIFISQTGEVFPSGFLPLSAGNIRKRSLVDIYRRSPLFRQLRSTEQLGGRCGRCEFAPVCGGSRSRAYALTGDPLAEEPYCTYVPGTFPFQEDLAVRLGKTPS